MHIARTTVQQIYAAARKKLADTLVEGADWLSRLCAEGYDTQIVMSMDITRRSNFEDRGGVGYSYLLDTFAPLASEAGVPDRAWENLLYRNALRIYKGQK